MPELSADRPRRPHKEASANFHGAAVRTAGSSDRPYYLVLAVASATAVFAVDAGLDLGVAAAVPYAGVIWLAYASRSRQSVWMAAIACSLLTLLGLVVSPGDAQLSVFVNRGLALLAIWVTALPCLQVLRLVREAEERTEAAERDRMQIARQRDEDLRKSAVLAEIMADLAAERTKLRAQMTRNEQLAEIVESSDDAIVTTTLDGIVTSWNRGAEVLYGYRAEEIVGQSADCLLPEDRPTEISEILDQVGRDGRVEPFETVRVAQDGTRREVSLTVTTVRDADGKPIGGCSVARDISELKRLVKALREMNQELEQRVKKRTAQLARANESLLSSNVELQQFAYVASHDLQAPLRTIAVYAGFLKSDYGEQLGEEANQHVDRIVGGATRMQTLIKNLLTLARVESSVAQFDPVDLNKPFQDALELLRGAIEDEEADVKVGYLPLVPADPIQMAQLFQNLIGNGIKYRGEETPRVSVTAEAQGDEWKIVVQDNGIGVSPKHRKRVFDVFTRLKTDTTHPGTGLGLAICRRIVNRHGGRIWVESQEGKGSAFCFTIPKSARPMEPRTCVLAEASSTPNA